MNSKDILLEVELKEFPDGVRIITAIVKKGSEIKIIPMTIKDAITKDILVNLLNCAIETIQKI